MKWQTFNCSLSPVDLAAFFAGQKESFFFISQSSVQKGVSFLSLFSAFSIQLFADYQKDKIAPHMSLCKLSNPWERLKHYLPFSKILEEDDIPAYCGYLAYEMGAFAPESKTLPFYEDAFPLVYMTIPCLILCHDQQNGWRFCIREEFCQYLCTKDQALLSRFMQTHLVESLFDEAFHLNFGKKKSKNEALKLFSKDEYKDKFNKVQDYLLEGDCYQLNLTEKIIFSDCNSAFSYYQSLLSSTEALYSAYLNCDDFQIVSISPERFILKKGELLETCPIKGTAKRSKNANLDAVSLQSLLNSEKEKAELLMITDLLRNDFSKVSQTASVRVKALRELQVLPHLYHTFSIIESKVLPHLNPVDIVRRLFPGGSITGCPKIRAIEIIHELEKEPRGVYTGSIGYFTLGGNIDLNIAIRTMVFSEGQAWARFGGAIVYDSNCEGELEEILLKAEPILSFYAEV